MADPLRVIVVETNGLPRQLLRLGLADHGILVIAEAATPDDLGVLCDADPPDLVVSSPRASGSSVAAAVEALEARGIPVLVLASEPSAADALGLLRCGAVGYVTRDLTMEALADAIRVSTRGGRPLDARVTSALIDEWRHESAPRRPSALSALSAREVEVLRRLSAGGTTKQVAHSMGISAKTIENHKTRIFSKLAVRTQTEAIAAAIAAGILDEADAKGAP